MQIISGLAAVFPSCVVCVKSLPRPSDPALSAAVASLLQQPRPVGEPVLCHEHLPGKDGDNRTLPVSRRYDSKTHCGSQSKCYCINLSLSLPPPLLSLSRTPTHTVLTEEQKQNVGMFIDPVTKFFEVRLSTQRVSYRGQSYKAVVYTFIHHHVTPQC